MKEINLYVITSIIIIVIGIFMLGYITGNYTAEKIEIVRPYQPIINIYNETIQQNKYDYSKHYNEKQIKFPLRHKRKCEGKITDRYATGSSSQPFIADGDTYFTMELDWKYITVHDVPLFDANLSKPVLHAFTYKNEDYGYTAGYHINKKDSWTVTPDMVKGVYCVK